MKIIDKTIIKPAITLVIINKDFVNLSLFTKHHPLLLNTTIIILFFYTKEKKKMVTPKGITIFIVYSESFSLEINFPPK